MVKRLLSIFLCSAAAYSCNHVDFKGLFMPTGDGVEKRFEQSAEMNEDLYAGAVVTCLYVAGYIAVIVITCKSDKRRERANA